MNGITNSIIGFKDYKLVSLIKIAIKKKQRMMRKIGLIHEIWLGIAPVGCGFNGQKKLFHTTLMHAS